MPYTDYLLGVSDLTGEVMRFAIVAMSIKGGRKKAGEVCAFVRACQGGKFDHAAMLIHTI